MTRREYAGGAAPLVLTGSIGSSDTSIGTTGTATGWPTGGVGKFLVVIDRGLATEEKLLVESRSGNTLTLASASDRGQDDTAAASHLAGATVEHVVGAIDLDEANAHINNTGDDNHSQYYNAARLNTAHDIEARHTFGAALGTPATPASTGNASSAGSGDNAAREDHVHKGVVASDSYATPVATGTANAAGAAATLPRSDHVHLGPGRRALQTSAFTNETTSSSTYVQVASQAVTTVAGRTYRISFSGLFITASGGTSLDCDIQEDGVSLIGGNGSFFAGGAGENYMYLTSTVSAISAPSAGAHTYTFKIKSTGGGSVTASAFYFLVEDIGA